jgi:nitroreductase
LQVEEQVKQEQKMDTLKAIRSKHAVRKFSDQPVPDEVIEKILDAGRRSQSSKNTQPWQFIVVRKRETLVALSKMGDYAGHLAGANFAVLLVGYQGELWNGFDWHSFDIGQASSYLQLAGWELGLGSCIATIYKADEAKALLGVPAERTLSVALSFGYPALDWENAKMGGRRPLDDVVRWETW